MKKIKNVIILWNMKKLNIDISKYQKEKSKITNSRQFWMEKFLNRLNPLREQAGYKPYTPARLGMKLRFAKTDYLGQFYGECEDSKNFSAYFEWKLKVK